MGEMQWNVAQHVRLAAWEKRSIMRQRRSTTSVVTVSRWRAGSAYDQHHMINITWFEWRVAGNRPTNIAMIYSNVPKELKWSCKQNEVKWSCKQNEVKWSCNQDEVKWSCNQDEVKWSCKQDEVKWSCKQDEVKWSCNQNEVKWSWSS